MSVSAQEFDFIDDTIAKRNAFILAVAMIFSSCSAIIVFTSAGIVGTMLSPATSLITLPVSTFVIGIATTTIPASLFMGKFGRKFGFMLGAILAFFGSLLAIYALYEQSFVLFCTATFLLGSYMAFTQYYRFAAADRATEDFKGKAISWVLAGGIGGSIFGPLLLIYSREALAPVMFAGTFVVSAILALCAFALTSLVNIPVVKETVEGGPTRPLSQMLTQPRLIVAIVVGMVSYGGMILLMTATPIAMVAHGFTVDDSAWVIQWHSLAMFGPSFFTGHLIARFGVERIVFAGLTLLVGAAVVDLAGLSFGHFSGGLILLGLGWNFGFIGATTMVTQCYQPAEKSKVQAFNDFAVFATVALASLTSGKLFSASGWSAVNMALFPMVAVAVLALIWLFVQSRNQPQATS